MEIQCASFKVEQNPYQTESVSSHTNGHSFDNYGKFTLSSFSTKPQW